MSQFFVDIVFNFNFECSGRELVGVNLSLQKNYDQTCSQKHRLTRSRQTRAKSPTFHWQFDKWQEQYLSIETLRTGLFCNENNHILFLMKLLPRF